MSRLIGARTTKDCGLEVTVFKKSRSPGGRTATRRADPGLSFDQGAQYFTARDPHSARFVEALIEQGIVAEWAGPIVQVERSEVRQETDQPRRLVGMPGMSTIARHLAADVALRPETRIVRLSRVGCIQHFLAAIDTDTTAPKKHVYGVDLALPDRVDRGFVPALGHDIAASPIYDHRPERRLRRVGRQRYRPLHVGFVIEYYPFLTSLRLIFFDDREIVMQYDLSQAAKSVGNDLQPTEICDGKLCPVRLQ